MSTIITTKARPAEGSGTFVIGDIPVHRLGFGAMQITGDGVWGEPADHSEAIAVLRRAVELGINLIDTADSYGSEVSERLVAQGWLSEARAKSMGGGRSTGASAIGGGRQSSPSASSANRSITTAQDRSEGTDGRSNQRAN